MAQILDGVAIAAGVRKETLEIMSQINFKPKLDVVLVGDHKPSEVYVNMKTKACNKVGIDFLIHRLPINSTEDDVKKLIKHLPDNQREVLEMRYYQDLSFKQIADLTGVSINTALGRMRYAILNMRKLAEDHNMELSLV